MSQSQDAFERAARPMASPHERSVSPPGARVVLRGIAVLSSVLGIILICLAANPEVLSTISTAHLLGALILTFAPALTLLAVRLDRRIASQVVVSTDRANSEHKLRIAKHDAHARVKRAHARADDAQTANRPQEHAA
ncbi:MAG: hypothetical protein NXI07_00050 [bacterium]|nr:hypothetical protein [bacterium]